MRATPFAVFSTGEAAAGMGADPGACWPKALLNLTAAAAAAAAAPWQHAHTRKRPLVAHDNATSQW